MLICYDDAGFIKFTLDGDDTPPGMTEEWLQTADQRLGDLSAWKIVDGQLTLWSNEPLIRAYRDDVNAKRLTVISAGTTVTVTGCGLIALQCRPEDQATLQGLAFGAQLRVSSGDITTLTEFLDRDNVLHQLDPMQVLELWQKGAAFISAVYAASWRIKEMDPLTTDTSDPALWVVV